MVLLRGVIAEVLETASLKLGSETWIFSNPCKDLGSEWARKTREFFLDFCFVLICGAKTFFDSFPNIRQFFYYIWLKVEKFTCRLTFKLN